MPQDLLGVEVFAVGTWNDFKFTADDLREIAENTKALIATGRHKPPVKIGHKEQDDLLYGGNGDELGQPAFGWIENPRVVADKLVADFKSVPDVVVEAIRQGRYRQVSIEMNHLQHIGWVLTAVAIIGSDPPAVKTLEDLQAYLSANPVHVKRKASAPTLQFSEPQIHAAHVQDAPTPQLSGDIPMTDQEKAELERQKADNERLKRENQAFADERKVRIFAEAKEKAIAPFKELVTKGRLTPAILGEIEAAVEGQKLTFTEGAKLSVPMELVAKAAQSDMLPNGEQAHQTVDQNAAKRSTDPTAAFAEEAQKTSLMHKVPYEQAVKMVRFTNPAVFTAYTGFLDQHINPEVRHGR